MVQENPPPGSAIVWRAVIAATAGTVIEWYDFILYGAASALIFSKLFFPQFDPLAGTLASFATFALGYAVRPIGGIFFGRLGDRIGRKPVLLITLLLMGLATAAIGLLPSYGQIGIWAPILLLVIRVLQGFGAGAEYGGAVLVSGESAAARRGLFAAFPAAAVDFSFVLATGVLLLFTLMPNDQFLSWGWRIPFLLSLVVLIPGMFIRAKVAETADFVKAKATRQVTRTPVRDLIRNHPGRLLAGMGINFVPNLSYVFQIFAFAYVTQKLHLPTSTALIGGVLSGIFGSVAALYFGALSDRIGAKAVMIGGALFCALFAFPFFMLLDTGNPLIIWAAVIIGHLGERAVFGSQPGFYIQLFPVQIRYTGIAVAREITGAVIAGPLPLVATALLAWAHAPWPVSLLVIFYGLVTALAVYKAPLNNPAQIETTDSPV